MKETAFLYFHISLFACSHNTRSPASDYIRCIRTRVFKMQTPDMLKIPESGLIHFLLYWLRYKKIYFYIVTSRYAICSAVIICASLWWHVKMMICPG